MKKKKAKHYVLVTFIVLLVTGLPLSYVVYYASAPIITQEPVDPISGFYQIAEENQFWPTDKTWDPSVYSSESKTDEVPLNLQENSKLNISLDTVDMIIQASDTSRAVLHVYRMNTRSVKAYAINFSENDAQNGSYSISVNEPELRSYAVLELFLPANTLSQLDITATQSNVKVMGLELSNLSIDTSGITYIKDITATGDIRTGSKLQEIYAVGCTADKLHFNLESGSIEATDCTAKSMQFQTTSHVETDKLAAENVLITAGSVDVKNCTCPYNMTATSGDIEISMPRDASFQLSRSMQDGYFSNEFLNEVRDDAVDEVNNYTVKDGKIKLYAKTNTGSITLKILK